MGSAPCLQARFVAPACLFERADETNRLRWSYSFMERNRPSLVLPALGLIALVPIRMVLEFIIRGPRKAADASRRNSTKASATDDVRDTGIGNILRAASSSAKEQRIKERAFQIWLDEGRPNGRDREHWRIAESEIADEQQRGAEIGEADR